MKHTLLTIVNIIILCSASLSYAETLQEMEVIDHGLTTPLLRIREESILIVTSVIPKLSFASNMGIIHVDDSIPGKWIVYLRPGTNLITFMAEGYKSVSGVRLVVPKKKARKVEVKPLKMFGTLMVESYPPGGDVFLDGEDTGKQTPYRFEDQTAGEHLLVLKMAHYRADTIRVDIKVGETTFYIGKLQTVDYLRSEKDAQIRAEFEKIQLAEIRRKVARKQAKLKSLESVYGEGWWGMGVKYDDSGLHPRSYHRTKGCHLAGSVTGLYLMGLFGILPFSGMIGKDTTLPYRVTFAVQTVLPIFRVIGTYDVPSLWIASIVVGVIGDLVAGLHDGSIDPDQIRHEIQELEEKARHYSLHYDPVKDAVMVQYTIRW